MYLNSILSAIVDPHYYDLNWYSSNCHYKKSNFRFVASIRKCDYEYDSPNVSHDYVVREFTVCVGVVMFIIFIAT